MIRLDVLNVQVGFIQASPSLPECPFVVTDPTNKGTTIVVAQVFCLTIFNLSQTQNAAYRDRIMIFWNISSPPLAV